jgi:hypothetical protein
MVAQADRDNFLIPFHPYNNNNFGRISDFISKMALLKIKKCSRYGIFNNKLLEKSKIKNVPVCIKIYSLFQNIQEWILK